MKDRETFTDPPAPVDLPAPPEPPGLLARLAVFEGVAVVTWALLAAGGAANPDPAGLLLIVPAVAVFAWLSDARWGIRRGRE